MRWPTSKPLGALCLWSPQMAHSWHPVVCALHLRAPLPAPHGWLPAHADGECKPLQTATEHVQKASPMLWNWESTHILEHLRAQSWKSRQEALSAWPGLCGITRRYTILRIHPPKSEWDVWSRCVHGKDPRKPQKPSRADCWWRLSPKASQSLILEQVIASSNTKTARNVKNQGNMTPQKEHYNFPVTDPKELPDKEFKIFVLRKLSNP